MTLFHRNQVHRSIKASSFVVPAFGEISVDLNGDDVVTAVKKEVRHLDPESTGSTLFPFHLQAVDPEGAVGEHALEVKVVASPFFLLGHGQVEPVPRLPIGFGATGHEEVVVHGVFESGFWRCEFPFGGDHPLVSHEIVGKLNLLPVGVVEVMAVQVPGFLCRGTLTWVALVFS